MSLLNFSNSEEKAPQNLKSLKLFLGFGALVGVIALGSTLAASISLNSSSPIEFGQGIAQTTACDGQVKVTPISSYVNNELSGFKFTAITLSDLDGTIQTDPTDNGCAGKTFTIKSYDSSGHLLKLTYSISLANDGSFSSPDGVTDGNETEGDSNSSVKLTFEFPFIDAENVYRITIESSTEEFMRISPAISTNPQTFVFNPTLNLIPTFHPNTGPCYESENPGWIKIIAPNGDSYISIYTYGDVNRDTTLKIFDTEGNFVVDDDDDNYDMLGDEPGRIETSQYASDQAEENFSALTFFATSGHTYYIGLADCEEGTPVDENVNIGYYYEPLP